jgi:hypothetical protein
MNETDYQNAAAHDYNPPAAKVGMPVEIKGTAAPQPDNEIYPTVCLCDANLRSSTDKRLHQGTCPCTSFDDELIAIVHKRTTYGFFKALYDELNQPLVTIGDIMHKIDSIRDEYHTYGSAYNSGAAGQSLALVLKERGAE